MKKNTTYLWGKSMPKNPIDVRVCGVFFDNDKVLVVKCADQRHNGKYDFPGGFLVFGESLEDALWMRYAEDTGLYVEQRQLIGAWEDFFEWQGKEEHYVAIYFLVYSFGGGMLRREFASLDDVSGVYWMKISDLSSKNMTKTAWSALQSALEKELDEPYRHPAIGKS